MYADHKSTLSVCATVDSLLVSVLDPPSLRIIPFPSFYAPGQALPTTNTLGATWTGLATGMSERGESEAVVLDEWDWLVGNDRDGTVLFLTRLRFFLTTLNDHPTAPVTISELILLPSPEPEYSTEDQYYPPARTPHDFLMLTSDGRAYFVHWGPFSNQADTALTSPVMSASSSSPRITDAPFDKKPEEAKWSWRGVCFHPKRTLEGEDGIGEQEKELDKGKGGSTLALGDKMALVAVGCEE